MVLMPKRHFKWIRGVNMSVKNCYPGVPVVTPTPNSCPTLKKTKCWMNLSSVACRRSPSFIARPACTAPDLRHWVTWCPRSTATAMEKVPHQPWVQLMSLWRKILRMRTWRKNQLWSVHEHRRTLIHSFTVNKWGLPFLMKWMMSALMYVLFH